MESDTGSMLWLIIDILLPIALGAALVYGVVMWSRRDKSPEARRVRDEATERVYRESEQQEQREKQR